MTTNVKPLQFLRDLFERIVAAFAADTLVFQVSLSVVAASDANGVSAPRLTLYLRLDQHLPTNLNILRGFTRRLSRALGAEIIKETAHTILVPDLLLRLEVRVSNNSEVEHREALFEYSRGCGIVGRTALPMPAQARDRWRTRRSIAPSDAAIWIALHSSICKLHRGEWFEAIHRIDEVRQKLLSLGNETSPDTYRDTFAFYSRDSIARAIQGLIDRYALLRDKRHLLSRPVLNGVEAALLNFLAHGAAIFTHSPTKPHTRAHGRSTPPHIAAFADRISLAARENDSVLAVCFGGSWLGPYGLASQVGDMDTFSDLDVYVLLRECSGQTYADVAVSLAGIARSLVAEARSPDYIRCLFAEPLIRCDFRLCPETPFTRFENPEIFWERDSAMTEAMTRTPPDPSLNYWPQEAPEDLDHRFWSDILDAISLLRFQNEIGVVTALSDIRLTILGPMIARSNGEPSIGLRRLEMRFPVQSELLKSALFCPGTNRPETAIRCAIDLYSELRKTWVGVSEQSRAEVMILRDTASMAT